MNIFYVLRTNSFIRIAFIPIFGTIAPTYRQEELLEISE